MKQRVNLCIDFELYMESKRRHINLSQEVNKYLKHFMDMVEVKDKDYDKLILKIKELEDNESDIKNEKIVLQVKLDKLNEEREKEKKKLAMIQYNTIKANLHNMI